MDIQGHKNIASRKAREILKDTEALKSTASNKDEEAFKTYIPTLLIIGFLGLSVLLMLVTSIKNY